MTKKTPEARTERLREMREMLKHRAMTGPEIAKAMNLDRSTVRVYINEIRDEIYVAGWVRPKNTWSPMWKLGHLPDAAIPEIDDEPEIEERQKTIISMTPHPLMTALFGNWRAKCN